MVKIKPVSLAKITPVLIDSKVYFCCDCLGLRWRIEAPIPSLIHKKYNLAYSWDLSHRDFLTLTNIRDLLSPIRYFPSATRRTGNRTGHVH